MTKPYKLILIALLFMGCRKAFSPPNALSDTNKYLVIDGVINTGSDSTFIRLSRTKKFENGIVIDHETGAQVTVESDANGSYPLSETSPGTYASAPLNLNSTNKYRLHIKTSDGKEYLSDYVVVKNSPPIDSVGFTAKSDGVQIYVNTHDQANNTKYYRWEYSEAWEFHSTYKSLYDGISAKPRSFLIYYCYSHDTSSNIVLASSSGLSNDVIYQSPITSIDPSSEKIEIEYSILVRQYALTSDAYNFWSNLHKNSETNGSIFDAQPSDNQTNYHCLTNPGELVVGYLSAGSTSSKRIFIKREQLLASYNPRYSGSCSIDTAHYAKNEYGLIFSDPNNVAIDGIIFNPNLPNGIANELTYSTADCVDCRTRGVLQPPPFWK